MLAVYLELVLQRFDFLPQVVSLGLTPVKGFRPTVTVDGGWSINSRQPVRPRCPIRCIGVDVTVGGNSVKCLQRRRRAPRFAQCRGMGDPRPQGGCNRQQLAVQLNNAVPGYRAGVKALAMR